MEQENDIINSWQANAENWINIIDSNGIESRKLVTNNAIIDTVTEVHPHIVLDLGCGEGWLSQQLVEKGMTVTGIDVIPALIEKARQRVNADFRVASYEEISKGKIVFPQLFDAIVINFALIGKESTEQLLPSLPGYLTIGGSLFIQTLHPHHRKATGDYSTGWKSGSWDGLGEQFTQPYDWYFRTLEDWLLLLHDAGFTNIKTKEIIHPHTAAPLSVIFCCKL